MPKIAAKKTKAPDSVGAYIRSQKPKDAAICKFLRKEIAATLPKAAEKIYHRSPVWFIGNNAVVGFSVKATQGVRLLFWNDQSLNEPELAAFGKFKAAEIQFRDVADIDTKNLRHWLKKACKDVWDLSGMRKG